MTEHASDEWPAPGTVDTRRRSRWDGIAGVALLVAVVGAFARSGAVVLAGTVGVAVAVAAGAVAPPTPALGLDRSVDPDGDRATVTLSIHNEGTAWLTDLQVVDGVPSDAVVVDGAPACRTALGPGESTTVTYTVETGRGRYPFRPALVTTRDPAGLVERSARLDADGTEAVGTDPRFEPVETVALRRQAAPAAGRRPAEETGSGVEFHALREYRHGDPLSRIDWNRWAKTGEPATKQFRAERAATVVLVLDTREAAALAPDTTEPTAVERGVDAAARLFATLTDRGDRVGIATLDDDRQWLAPGLGRTHLARARALLTDDQLREGTATAFDPADTAAWLADRLPASAQAVVLTPLCDDAMSRFLVRLEALGVPVSVCSPDPTAEGSTGRRLAGLERRRWLRQCRDAGLAVVDWPADTPLERALDGRVDS